MSSSPTARTRVVRSRLTVKQVTALVLVGLALTFIVQNRQIVAITFFIPTTLTPLWAALAVVFVVGGATGYLLARQRK